MSGLAEKVRKIKYKLKHEIFVWDNILLMIAGLCCLGWTWGSISSMTRNWALAQELANKQREKALLELEVETLELENEYYASSEYQELVARKYQNKVLPGETMIYLPANSEEAKNKHKVVVADTEPVDKEVSNFQQWTKFLFGI